MESLWTIYFKFFMKYFWLVGKKVEMEIGQRALLPPNYRYQLASSSRKLLAYLSQYDSLLIPLAGKLNQSLDPLLALSSIFFLDSNLSFL